MILAALSQLALKVLATVSVPVFSVAVPVSHEAPVHAILSHVPSTNAERPEQLEYG